jgi:16S rRNA (cytidine1402-2'-O)-methyltransferase
MEKGTLYIVATPIGNLEDMTLRAIETLKSVDLIAAEDTRRSGRLLRHYDIRTPLTSYHDFTGKEKREKLVGKILDGADIALISDAGTPGIADPGYRLIQDAIGEEIPLYPIPGPSVLTAALSISGLPTDAFYFSGYLPQKARPRQTRLAELKPRAETLVLYEAPHRILAALKDMLEILGDRRITLVREMTKLHEETFRGPISEALEHFRSREKIRGEITLVVHGAPQGETGDGRIDIAETVESVIRERQISRREAAEVVAKRYGISKNRAYQDSLKSKKST